MKILVIQNSKLGDMVCTTPVFRAIKKGFPEAELLVMGNNTNREVLRGNPNVDGYIVSGANLDLKGIDIAILLTPEPDILMKLLKARIKKIIVPKIVGGFSPYFTKKFRLLSLLAIRVPHRMGHYAPQEYLNMLKPLGINSDNTKKELFLERNAEEKIEVLLGRFPGKKIAIAPGAGNKIKEWPVERFREVARHIIDTTQATVVVVGGSGDKTLANEMKKGLPQERVLDTVGQLSIEELKALIKHMDMFISVDTGPIYIAEAFGVPTIDIIGPIDENEQPPRGAIHRRVIDPARKAPQLFVMNARSYDEKLAHEAIENIKPAMVIEQFDNLWKNE